MRQSYYQVHVIILVLAKVPKGSNPQICSARPGWRIRGSLSKWDCRVIIVTVDHSGYPCRWRVTRSLHSIKRRGGSKPRGCIYCVITESMNARKLTTNVECRIYLLYSITLGFNQSHLIPYLYWYNPVTWLCLSISRTWISNAICRGLFVFNCLSERWLFIFFIWEELLTITF